MTIGDRIKAERIAQGKTLEYVASIVNVGRATIHKYENNIISTIPSDKIELLAQALNTTPAYLMGWEVAEEKLILLKKEELDEMNAIFLALNSANRAKLLELGRLFLGAQRSNGDS